MRGEVGMADKTFGVKVSEELHDKVKSMIENSGGSAKDWFEKAVAISELQSIKQGSADYNQDLNELEVHTARIFELVSNMVQRSIYIKDHAIKEISDKLEQKESIIGEYQGKINSAVEEEKLAKESMKALEQEKEELFKQLKSQQSANENNQLLLNEYKERNDTLSGLVNKYQTYANENEKLKEQFATEKSQLLSQIKEISNQNNVHQNEIKELKQQLLLLKNNHAIELERLVEKKDYEKDKALLEIERQYQQKLLQSNEEYNNRIKEMYEEINSIRREYEQRIGIQ
jgi:DNA repair exonuclease SbcCD ATPase subunit